MNQNFLSRPIWGCNCCTFPSHITRVSRIPLHIRSGLEYQMYLLADTFHIWQRSYGNNIPTIAQLINLYASTCVFAPATNYESHYIILKDITVSFKSINDEEYGVPYIVHEPFKSKKKCSLLLSKVDCWLHHILSGVLSLTELHLWSFQQMHQNSNLLFILYHNPHFEILDINNPTE